MKRRVEDVDKLPKWAQRKIAVLQQNVEALTREIGKVDAGETRVVQVADFNDMRVSYLRDREVYFLERVGQDYHDGIAVGMEDDGVLVVRTKSMMAITPWAGNSVRIENVEW